MYVDTYAKQKQLGAIKKGTAKQSRINAITEFDWQKQGLISSCGQAYWNIVMINVLKQLVSTRTDIELRPSGHSFPHVIGMQLAKIN